MVKTRGNMSRGSDDRSYKKDKNNNNGFKIKKMKKNPILKGNVKVQSTINTKKVSDEELLKLHKCIPVTVSITRCDTKCKAAVNVEGRFLSDIFISFEYLA